MHTQTFSVNEWLDLQQLMATKAVEQIWIDREQNEVTVIWKEDK